MITEAVNAAEAVIWGAIVSFAILAALLAYLAAALTYWVAVFARWVIRRTAAHIRYRHQVAAHRRQLRLERQQMARLRDAIAAAPLIPTQPGLDDHLLNACETAWTTEPRKEI